MIKPAPARRIEWDKWPDGSIVADIRDGSARRKSAIGTAHDAGRFYTFWVDELARRGALKRDVVISLYLEGRRIPRGQKAGLRAAIAESYSEVREAARKARRAAHEARGV